MNRAIHPDWFNFELGENMSDSDFIESLENLQRRLDAMGDFMSSIQEDQNLISDSSLRTKGWELMGLAEGLDNLIELYSKLLKGGKEKQSATHQAEQPKVDSSIELSEHGDELALRKLHQIKDISQMLILYDRDEHEYSHQTAATMAEVIHDLASDLIEPGGASGCKEVQS